MTSKEAFEKMVEICNYYHHTIVKDNIDIQTICDYPIDNIKKDLEVLEILKKNLHFSDFVAMTLPPMHKLESDFLTSKEEEIIMEWLNGK